MASLPPFHPPPLKLIINFTFDSSSRFDITLQQNFLIRLLPSKQPKYRKKLFSFEFKSNFPKIQISIENPISKFQTDQIWKIQKNLFRYQFFIIPYRKKLKYSDKERKNKIIIKIIQKKSAQKWATHCGAPTHKAHTHQWRGRAGFRGKGAPREINKTVWTAE